MPELPEVQTTASGLDRHVRGLAITDVWTDYGSVFHKGKDSIKDATYFKKFSQAVRGASIVSVSRRAKNVLIHLSTGDTILIHMKMTGHVLYGAYATSHGPDLHPRPRGFEHDTWYPIEAGPLTDPFNRFIHFVITLSNGKHIALSDMRKFAKVTLIPRDTHTTSEHLRDLGPEPLEDDFTFEVFRERLMKKPRGKIKPTLMDQSVISGVGNIYADESLWRAGIHPEEPVNAIGAPYLRTLYEAVRTTLARGIDFGGDSMSDYRNIHGERGLFQEQHQAYRRTGKPCTKRGCTGTIIRKVIAGRSGHFCSVHQKLTQTS